VGAKLEFPAWSEAVFASITNLSRTAKGHTEAAYGGTKAALPITDPKLLQERAEANLRRAISKVWSEGCFVTPTSHNLLRFIEEVADTVNDGLVEPRHRYRQHDTRADYPHQVAPEDISRAMYGFMQELSAELITPPTLRRAVEVAAWVEREFDWRIHPLRDACGRNAKLLGAWMLMRHDLPPAQFANRKEYYGAMEFGQAYWLDYYRSCIKPLPRAAA
jgi:hypothetical protein